MITIPLNHGKLALIDDEDYDLVCHYKWLTRPLLYKGVHEYWYAEAKDPLNRKRTVSLHRVVIGAQPHQAVSFFDGNTLNCQKANLTLGTSHKHLRRTRDLDCIQLRHQVRGDVYWTRVMFRGKFYTKTFKTAEDAKQWRDATRARLWGHEKGATEAAPTLVEVPTGLEAEHGRDDVGEPEHWGTTIAGAAAVHPASEGDDARD